MRTIFNHETGEYEEPIVRAPGNYDADLLSRETATKTVGESMTNQADAAQADINTIVKNFGLTGQIPVIQLPPSIEEFGEVFDFQSAMNLVAEANQAFARLPAAARARFHNDPHEFVAFIDDAYNADPATKARRMADLEEMGLKLPTPATPAPAPSPAATEPTET